MAARVAAGAYKALLPRGPDEPAPPAAPQEEAADAEAGGDAPLGPTVCLNPATTALLLIEFQNDFVHERGKMHSSVSGEMQRLGVLDNARSLLQFCRQRRIHVIHAPITYCSEYEENANRYGVLYNVSSANAFHEYEWGADFLESLAPLPDQTRRKSSSDEKPIEAEPIEGAPEAIVKGKHGLDSFAGTNLDELLQRRGVANLAICGLLTNCCVESTMRTGYEYGYNVITVTDCCAATSQEEHQNSVSNTFKMFSVPMTSEQFKGAFDDSGPPSPRSQRARLTVRQRTSMLLVESTGPRVFLPPSSVLHARQRSAYKDLALELMGAMLSRSVNAMVTIQVLTDLVSNADAGGGGLTHDRPFVRSLYVALVAAFVCDIILTSVLAGLWLFCKARASDSGARETDPDVERSLRRRPWSVLRCMPSSWTRARVVTTRKFARGVKLVIACSDLCKMLLSLLIEIVLQMHDVQQSRFDNANLVFTLLAGALEIVLFSTEASGDVVLTIE